MSKELFILSEMDGGWRWCICWFIESVAGKKNVCGADAEAQFIESVESCFFVLLNFGFVENAMEERILHVLCRIMCFVVL